MRGTTRGQAMVANLLHQQAVADVRERQLAERERIIFIRVKNWCTNYAQAENPNAPIYYGVNNPNAVEMYDEWLNTGGYYIAGWGGMMYRPADAPKSGYFEEPRLPPVEAVWYHYSREAAQEWEANRQKKVAQAAHKAAAEKYGVTFGRGY